MPFSRQHPRYDPELRSRQLLQPEVKVAVHMPKIGLKYAFIVERQQLLTLQRVP